MPEKSTMIASYGVSSISATYWFYDLLHHFTAQEWISIGVIFNSSITFITFAVYLFFQVKRWRREKRQHLYQHNHGNKHDH